MLLRFGRLSKGFEEFNRKTVLIRRIAEDHHLDWLRSAPGLGRVICPGCRGISRP